MVARYGYAIASALVVAVVTYILIRSRIEALDTLICSKTDNNIERPSLIIGDKRAQQVGDVISRG